MYHIVFNNESPYATCSNLAQVIRVYDTAFINERLYASCCILAQVIGVYNTYHLTTRDLPHRDLS